MMEKIAIIQVILILVSIYLLLFSPQLIANISLQMMIPSNKLHSVSKKSRECIISSIYDLFTSID